MLVLLLSLGVIALGIFLVTKGSDWMTDSLVPVADKLGTSYIAVASILVSIMLSIPEVFIAFYAFFLGHPGISLGVIIGSIICNIALMTGLSAMIKPLSVDKHVVIRDGVFALVIAFIVFTFGTDLYFSRSEGICLLLLFIPYVLNVWFFEKWTTKKKKQEELNEIKSELSVIGLQQLHMKPGIVLFIVGAIVLIGGSYIFSFALIKVAKLTGFSDVLIGLTIGAIGPTIPNIASAVRGTVKNYTKIAITETFGSDIFTLLVTLGLLATLSPFAIDARWLYLDIPMMIAMTALMLIFILKGHLNNESAISRKHGTILVLLYIAFLVINFYIV